MKHKLPICTDETVQYDFIQLFRKAQSDAFDVNAANGWWEDRNAIIRSEMPGALPIVVTGCLGLVSTEVSEAIEAVRKHGGIAMVARNVEEAKKQLAVTCACV